MADLKRNDPRKDSRFSLKEVKPQKRRPSVNKRVRFGPRDNRIQ